MRNKLAIVFCVHHKPFLMMGSLVSTLAQTFRDFDLFFIYQNGNGAHFEQPTYQRYFQIANEEGKNNVMLSDYDPMVRKVCDISGVITYEIEFENDHGLDSGAYYKFIRQGRWKDYAYTLFIQEGGIFTHSEVLESTIKFAQDRDIHFLSTGHEKRRLPKSLFLKYNTRGLTPSKMDFFHDEMIAETFSIFKRDSKFAALYDRWKSDFIVEAQNHIPDLGGKYRLPILLRKHLNSIMSNLVKRRKIKDNSKKEFLRHYSSVVEIYERFIFRYAIGKPVNRKISNPRIIANTKCRKLNELISVEEDGGVKFHMANDRGSNWYGACCINMLSRELLEKFSLKLDEFRIYDMLKLPFSATALEVIWGLIPAWLGFDKWFFDGIHRPRKSFTTYEWEDNIESMVHYLNWFYRGKLYLEHRNGFIKVKKMSLDLKHLRDELNNIYFNEEMNWS